MRCCWQGSQLIHNALGTQTTDIVLDGAGYMLAPGGYRRSQDGIAEGRTGRVTMQDFFGGQRRALRGHRDGRIGSCKAVSL